MKNRVLVANWKLYVRAHRAEALAKVYAARFGEQRFRSVTQILCPSFPEIEDVAHAAKKSALLLGAQDVGLVPAGPATGAISIRDLRDLGCRFVILGHSERRALGETDAVIANKLLLVAAWGLTPILCVGETRAVRRQRKEQQVVERQLRRALRRFRGKQLCICYEPVWAISASGKSSGACSPVLANAMRRIIEHTLLGIFRHRRITVRLLYGGSVSGKNIAAYVGPEGFHGALVGFASTKTAEYATMVRAIARR
ncbi:MAG: triose-phosphate isomerase family protein [bacterium]